MAEVDRPLGYVAVSAVCLVAHNAIMIAADLAGLSLWVALLTSYGVVVLIGYAGHSSVSFASRRSIRGLWRYALAMAGNIPAAFFLLWVAREVLHLPMTVAAPLATVVNLMLNYLLARWAIAGVFSRKE